MSPFQDHLSVSQPSTTVTGYPRKTVLSKKEILSRVKEVSVSLTSAASPYCRIS